MQQELNNKYQALKELLNYSYSPYSNFKTAAIVSTDIGDFKGVNVENSSFSLTNCAERTAVFNAITNGASKINHVYLISSSPRKDITPCGSCRQVLTEFMKPTDLITVFSYEGEIIEYKLQDLIPHSFSDTQLHDKQN